MLTQYIVVLGLIASAVCAKDKHVANEKAPKTTKGKPMENYDNYDYGPNGIDYPHYYFYDDYFTEEEKPDGISDEFWERYQNTSEPMQELLKFHHSFTGSKKGKLSMVQFGIVMYTAKQAMDETKDGKTAKKIFEDTVKRFPKNIQKKFYGIVDSAIDMLKTAPSQKRIKAQAKKVIEDYKSGMIFVNMDDTLLNQNCLAVPKMSEQEEMEAMTYNPVNTIAFGLMNQLVDQNKQMKEEEHPYLKNFYKKWTRDMNKTETRNETETYSDISGMLFKASDLALQVLQEK